MRSARVAGLLCCALLLSSPAWGSGFELAQQAASAGGTAHASTARRDDGSSAWYNPAALADGGGLRLQVGAAIAGSRITARSLPDSVEEPWTETSNTPVSVPPYLYGSWAGEHWAAGLSVNVPFGGGIRWAEGWKHRFYSLRSAPRFFRIAPFFAYRFGRFALSAGPHIDFGGTLIERATDHVSEEGRLAVAVRGFGVGGHASVFVSIDDNWSVGFAYKSRTRMNLAGEADFDVPQPFAADFPDQGVSTRLILPDRFVLGGAYESERFSVFLDTGLTLWQVYRELVLDFEREETPDSVITTEWRNTLAIRAGGELRIAEPLRLRLGLYADGLPGPPAPSLYLSPSSPDSTRIGVTAGIGIRPIEALRIDAFFEQITLLPRNSESPDLPPARYNGYAIAGGVSVTVLWDKS